MFSIYNGIRFNMTSSVPESLILLVFTIFSLYNEHSKDNTKTDGVIKHKYEEKNPAYCYRRNDRI